MKLSSINKKNFSRKRRKFFPLTTFIILLVVVVIFYSTRHQEPYEQIIKVGNKKVYVEIADTDEEQTKGLSNRKNMSENHGMLFVFQNEAQHAFWMKDTYIPLDHIYFSRDMKVTDIKGNFEPCLQSYCRAFIPKNKALYVLEVNGGFASKYKIAEGTEMKILKIKEILISDTLKLS